jgi:hypothetical protein
LTVFTPTRWFVFEGRFVAMSRPTPPATSRSATAASTIFLVDASAG